MRKELKQPSGLSGRDIVAIVTTLLLLAAAVFFLAVMLLGCEAGDDDNDTDVDCDAQYCWDTETHTETEAEDVDTEAEPGCTPEFTGYDYCQCQSPLICNYENQLSWAPGCEDPDPNDHTDPPPVCCCYVYYD